MRAVVDTNVLLSGLIRRGTPHLLLERIPAGTLSLVSSPVLLAELAGLVTRAKFRAALARSGTDPERMPAEVRFLAELIEPPPLPTPVSRDPDNDLLTLGAHAGIRIVTPTEALALIAP